MRTIRVLVLLIGAGLVVFAPRAVLAGGGGGGGGPCAGFSDGATLVMLDSCFNGVAHFVDAGTTLVVRNKGAMPHSFTAVDGSFDTGLLASGETAEIQVGADGIVRAYCTLHGTAAGNGMAGILVVGNLSPEGVPTATRPAQVTALAALGGILGGAALAVVLSRRRPIGPPGD